MTTKQIREALNMGASVVDLGQITKDGKSYLNRLVREGYVEIDRCHRFTQIKRAYVARDIIPEVA